MTQRLMGVACMFCFRGMIVSHRHKFIFICNGKTGTTSIERGLGGLDESVDMNAGAPGLWDNKHMPAAVAKAVLPSPVWDGYFKFAFVRNPYDWCVSQFKHNFCSALRVRKLLRHPIMARQWLRAHRENRVWRNKRMMESSDVEFLFNHLKQYRGLPGAEGLYQCNYVNDPDGNRLIDFVGKFESLERDVERVQKQIGVRFELPHLNATERPHYSRFLAPSAVEAVGRLWSVDFETFGYEKDRADE